MKRIRHTPEQIIRKLNTADQLIVQDQTVAEVCRVLEASQPTYHRWRQLYGAMKAEEAKRLTQLEKENARLKRPQAEAELDKAMVKDLAEGNSELGVSPAGRHGPAGALPGIPAEDLPPGGSAPQHTAPSDQGCFHRGGEAVLSSP
jgi:putative transposase